MRRRESKSKKISDLRKRAEKKISKSADSNIQDLSPEEIKKLVHDLSVHQIELEMQVDELQKSKADAAEAQEKYSDLYNFAPVGYFTLNSKGDITETNITGASLLGTDKRSLVNKPFLLFVAPEGLKNFQSHLEESLKTKSKQAIRLRLVRKDHSLINVLMHTIAVMDKGFYYYRSSVTDITEITRTQEALHESEALLRALTENSPDAIYVKDTESRWLVANPALLHIVGRTAQEVVREIWKDFHTDTASRNIALTVNGMPKGYGDRTMIRQVFSNLLGNAVKFTKLRNLALVEVGGHTDRNENVYYVKDNGAGFDMAYYDKLFGIFQRLHRADEFEGTGVGLATVQRVIQRHGGRVWAEGKVDGGATFYFSLPLQKSN